MQQAQFPKETGSDGEFRRQTSAFRQWVRADGSSEFPAESGRYHLYVSSACPWAHRVIIARTIKGLEDMIGMTIVDPLRDGRGWKFTDEPDPLHDFQFLAEAYEASSSQFEGRVTVPVLWDKQSNRIVNNESSEILRMLNSEFNAFGNAEVDLYPEP
ncbi:MAG: putative glutathione S-transferase, partial [Candidatus Paceibacteria bacterium]